MHHELDPSSVGPVDVAVISFADNGFDGTIAPELAALEEAGTVRVIDLAFIRKTDDGSAEWVEVLDAEISDAFAGLDDPDQDLLNDVDLELLAESLDPGTAAVVVVWENSWATELSAAIRRSGGALIAQDRIPHEIVVDAIQAL